MPTNQATANNISELSSDVLYQMFEQRKAEEQAAQLRANAEAIAQLRAKKKELNTAYNKEMKALDAEIARLSGKPSGSKRNSTEVPVTEIVLEIVGKAGQTATSDIKTALERRGIDATNLPQTLAYLKRTGRLTSPARTMYQLAG